MLAYLKGRVKDKGEDFLLVVCNDLGYKIFVGEETLKKTKLGEKIEFYLFDHLREDTHDLYGFRKKEELDFFEQLDKVGGVGPKSALAVVSSYKIEEIKKSIAQGDTHLLTKIPGIGRKTAERIILELRGKLPVSQKEIKVEDEVITALTSLGYTRSETLKALEGISADLSTEEKIKEALKYLGR